MDTKAQIHSLNIVQVITNTNDEIINNPLLTILFCNSKFLILSVNLKPVLPSSLLSYMYWASPMKCCKINVWVWFLFQQFWQMHDILHAIMVLPWLLALHNIFTISIHHLYLSYDIPSAEASWNYNGNNCTVSFCNFIKMMMTTMNFITMKQREMALQHIHFIPRRMKMKEWEKDMESGAKAV